MRSLSLLSLFLLPLAAAGAEKSGDEYRDFIFRQAAALRARDAAPASREEWAKRREALRAQLLDAWGGFPTTACPLDAKKLGELRREGYTVERLLLQTLPGVWMTANAYVPHGPGKKPAILMVHGHWKGAKQDPVVQSRCIGAAKLGFFVLVVDAFGAGERGIGKALLVHLAQRCVREGLGRFEWAVLDWNQPSIDFYRSQGARPMSEWQRFRLDGEALAKLGAT